MCQITLVGSCHFDAIQTEDACQSCADGDIVSLFNVISTDCFPDVCFNVESCFRLIGHRSLRKLCLITVPRQSYGKCRTIFYIYSNEICKVYKIAFV